MPSIPIKTPPTGRCNHPLGMPVRHAGLVQALLDRYPNGERFDATRIRFAVPDHPAIASALENILRLKGDLGSWQNGEVAHRRRIEVEYCINSMLTRLRGLIIDRHVLVQACDESWLIVRAF